MEDSIFVRFNVSFSNLLSVPWPKKTFLMFIIKGNHVSKDLFVISCKKS